MTDRPIETTITAGVDDLLRDIPPRDLVERIVAAERARIVAWLRNEADGHGAAQPGAMVRRLVADQIERGEHAV